MAPGGKRPSSAVVHEATEGAEGGGRLVGRERAGSITTVSMPELVGGASGAAQLPQKRLVSGFSVAQLGQRDIGSSVAGDNGPGR